MGLATSGRMPSRTPLRRDAKAYSGAYFPVSCGAMESAPEDCSKALAAAFAHNGAALDEATVDPNEPLLPPKRIEKYAKNLEKVLKSGTAGASEIKQALEEEPARSMLKP